MAILFTKTRKFQNSGKFNDASSLPKQMIGTPTTIASGDGGVGVRTASGLLMTADQAGTSNASIAAAYNPNFSNDAAELGKIIGMAPKTQMRYQHTEPFTQWVNSGKRATDFPGDQPIANLVDAENKRNYPILGNQFQSARKYLPSVTGNDTFFKSAAEYYDRK